MDNANHTTIHPFIIDEVYNVIVEHNQFTMRDFLIVLHWLKVYPTEDNGLFFSKIKSRKTYRKTIRRVLLIISDAFNVIKLSLSLLSIIFTFNNNIQFTNLITEIIN